MIRLRFYEDPDLAFYFNADLSLLSLDQLKN